MVKESPSNAGEPDSVPGSGLSPGEGNGNLLQYLPGNSHGQRTTGLQAGYLHGVPESLSKRDTRASHRELTD